MKSEILRTTSRIASAAVITCAAIALVMFPLVELGRRFEREDHRESFGVYFDALTSTLKAENLAVSNNASVGGVLTVGSCIGCGAGGGITNSAGANVIMKSDGTNAVASSISDTTSLITATHAMSIAPSAGAAGTAPLTVRADTTNLKALAMQDAAATNSAGFRWADATHVAFRDMTNGADLVSWAIGSTGTSANGLLTALAGVTSTAAINTIGSIKGGRTTDTTSNGLVNDYPLPANTSLLIFNNASSDIQLTGMTPGAAGQWMLVFNLSSGGHNLTVFDSNTNSLLANRFRIATSVAAGGGAAALMAQGTAALVFFDGSNWWWFVLWNAIAPANVTAIGDVAATSVLTGNTVRSTGHYIAISSAVGLTNATCASSSCTDVAGTVTTTSTSMIITFAGTYTGADDAGCILQEINGTAVPTFQTSATALTATTVVNGVKYHYVCMGH